MFQSDQYQLVDFGQGWKIENFGGVRVARQTPSIGENTPFSDDGTQQHPPSKLCFHRLESGPIWQGDFPRDWKIQHRSKTFLLKPTPAGQLGVFPEQASNWAWIEELPFDLKGLTALNLFAYTGGTSMALASRDAAVTHVDSAKNVVQWARQNASRSGLSESPIRWICEDATKFVNREIKRGSRYDILVADPPSYGKGPKNELWKFSQNFEPLLKSLSQIAAEKLRILVFSCHTTGFYEDQLLRLVAQHFDLSSGIVTTKPLNLSTNQGSILDCGICLRYVRKV